ncbi:MAG TPA: universal stress protein [Actinoplanes sp.]|jgi:nucleotide-binding universal stress UspA family protein|nr:universal stress protein [Actinoplanes sp.]
MTSVDERPFAVSPLPARVGNEPNDVAAAIVRELRYRSPDAIVSYGTPELRVVGRQPVLVSGTSSRRRQAVVAAAVDDDGNAGAIVQYAAAAARRADVSLRAVHVWTGSRTLEDARMCWHERMSDADRLLTAVLYDNLAAEEADATERQILHDQDPVSALIALSTDVSLLVVAARCGSTASDKLLGGTVRALAGRTACPLAVLPPSGG